MVIDDRPAGISKQRKTHSKGVYNTPLVNTYHILPLNPLESAFCMQKRETYSESFKKGANLVLV